MNEEKITQELLEINITKENIEKNLKRIPIKIEGEIVATATFDSNDIITQKLIMELVNTAYKTDTGIKNIKITSEEQELVKKDLKNSEDFDKASEVIGKMSKILEIGVEGIDGIKEKVDAIFGNGIFDIVARYGENGEFLHKLLEMAFKEVSKASNKKINPYLKDSDTDVLVEEDK